MVHIRLHRDGIDYIVNFEEISEWDESMEYAAFEKKFYKVVLREDKDRALWNVLVSRDILRKGKFPYYDWEDNYEEMANNLLEGYLLYGVSK